MRRNFIAHWRRFNRSCRDNSADCRARNTAFAWLRIIEGAGVTGDPIGE
jgi:hypothetical protein